MKFALFKKITSLLELDRNTKYKVLDIGCGQGDLLGQLSSSMDSESYLVGIDEAEHLVESAKESYPNLEFHREKFTDSLSFKDDSFEIVLSVDTLECIPNKSALISEIHRILTPGGKIVIAHWDWDTQVYNSANKSIIRKFVAAFSDWQQDWMKASDGQMGRRLWSLFEGSGKFKGKIVSYTLLETEFREGKYGFDRLRDLSSLVKNGIIETTDYEIICAEMQDLSDTSKYFYSINSYIYAGEPV
ncbi:MAG: SAM-dependent methyltransferase [Nitrospirales bacterium]|nr:MAG: SAM-dependent methyltransferase [Nitrospirales bacterium]